MNIFLTYRQLINEKAHYGPAFDKSNYIVIQKRNLNEGALGLVLSIPALIKIFRFCIEKGQEYWLRIFYKDLYQIIDKRTLTSLLDEDSLEDMVDEESGGFTREQASKTFKVIKLITKEFGMAYKAADSVSGVKTPHGHKSKEEVQKRKNRIELLGDNPITVLSEILGAIQHGIHHLYTSMSNIIGRASVEAFEAIFGDIQDQSKKKKIADVIGNIFFLGLITFALFSGSGSFSAMDGVKVLEILAESCEICEIVAGTAILLPKVKLIIDKLKEIKTKFNDSKIVTCIEGLIEGSAEKVKSLFQDLENSLNVQIYSSRFSPEMLRSKRKKQKKADRSDPEQFDYYGNPVNPLIDSYVRDFINLFLS